MLTRETRNQDTKSDASEILGVTDQEVFFIRILRKIK